jgi:hypothetical protein
MKRELLHFTSVKARAEFTAQYSEHPGHTATALSTITGPDGAPIFPVLFTTWTLD